MRVEDDPSEISREERKMLARFCAYGFLKNQQYYEPFIILAFREFGLSFLQIGTLIAFREVCVNLLEIPTGAVADVWGRRRSMVCSFGAYVLSFVLFGLSRGYWQLFPAMFLFAIGETFRTGTHKAMIFDWLRQRGREAESTRIYGYTRSWSKLGSALSAVVAAVLVYASGNFRYIFWLAVPPYLLNMVNLWTYPRSLDGAPDRPRSTRQVLAVLWVTLRQVVKVRTLRGLVVESMAFEGTFRVVKDYLQPAIKQVALTLPLLTALSGERRTAILVGVVFFLIYLASSAASRSAYLLSERAGSDDRAAGWLWWANMACYGTMALLLWQGWVEASLALFLALYLAQNLWRPTLISRFNAQATPETTATVLSVESQAKTLACAVIAPLLGWGMDRAGLWSVAAIGTSIVIVGWIAHRWSVPARDSSGELALR